MRSPAVGFDSADSCGAAAGIHRSSSADSRAAGLNSDSPLEDTRSAGIVAALVVVGQQSVRAL